MCFNKFFNKKYLYDFDNNNSYYISEFDTAENLDRAKMALKNGKIVFWEF